MQRINASLHRTIKKYKIEDKVRSHQALSQWEKVIAEFMPQAAQKTMAISLEKGVLKIAALSKDLAYDIHLYQKRLIEALNEIIGKRLVFVIVCEY